MTYAIAAAGTGGHVFPGLAVGEALVEAGVERSEVLYVGGTRLEATVYPGAGFPFLGVELIGLQRRITAANLRIPKVVKRAIDQMATEFVQRRVSVVLGLGGYVTVPAGLAARRLSIPMAVSEQNAHAGLANRMIGRFALRRFGSFPQTVGLPGAEWVGNPIRSSVLSTIDPPVARETYGLGAGAVLGVFGGSLGAVALNDAVASNIERWRASGIEVLHLVGPRNEGISEMAAETPGWIVVPFEERMQNFYAACDLVVARAGGGVAELTATATPSILVPGGFGSGGHQAANARALTQTGAAVTLDESDLGELGALVTDILSDGSRLEMMRTAARSVAKPHAAATIAEVLRELHD